MSCLYCGGENCGSSGGGHNMCKERQDNKDSRTRWQKGVRED